jgi:THAP domain
MENPTGKPLPALKYGGAYCCVVGCTNSQYRDNHKGIKFFRFPKDEKQKLLWISRVKRLKEDGTLWQPSSASRICSSHFSEGLRSQDPRSPSYAPSIFPTGHVKPKGNEEVQRYKRAQKRSLHASFQASLPEVTR